MLDVWNERLRRVFLPEKMYPIADVRSVVIKEDMIFNTGHVLLKGTRIKTVSRCGNWNINGKYEFTIDPCVLPSSVLPIGFMLILRPHEYEYDKERKHDKA